MKKKKVILDCDDVLFQCNELALKRLNAAKGTDHTLEEITRYGLLGNELDERLACFKDPKFVRSQQPYPGACGFVRELSKKAEVLIATSVPMVCASARMDAILRYFPEVKAENVIFGSRKDLLSADYMLDDCIAHLENTVNVTYPVLWRKPWNRSSGLLSVSSYSEFLSLMETMDTDTPKDLDMVCIIGPTGSGKTKISETLEKEGFSRVKSYTTRRCDDVHYHVLAPAVFEKKEKDLVEVSVYADEKYGIAKEDIDHILEEKRIPYTIVDLNGFMALRKQYNCLSVYVKAPKIDCVRSIICNIDDKETQVSRLMDLETEMRNEQICDMVITADDRFAVDQIRRRMNHDRLC